MYEIGEIHSCRPQGLYVAYPAPNGYFLIKMVFIAVLHSSARLLVLLTVSKAAMQEPKKSKPGDNSSYVRIELRTTPDIKKLLKLAAEEIDLSVNAFILNQAVKHAQNVLAYRHTTKLNDLAWAALNRAIKNPKPASDGLKKLMSTDEH